MSIVESWGTHCFKSCLTLFGAPTDEFHDLFLALDDLAGDEISLERYLGRIEPLGKDLAHAQSEGVRIMTMGGAKGLTVRATIIAGVEDGLVPRPNSDLSEERRMLYVAMTRAKEYLYCTWAKRRRGPTARAGTPSSKSYCQLLWMTATIRRRPF